MKNLEKARWWPSVPSTLIHPSAIETSNKKKDIKRRASFIWESNEAEIIHCHVRLNTWAELMLVARTFFPSCLSSVFLLQSTGTNNQFIFSVFFSFFFLANRVGGNKRNRFSCWISIIIISLMQEKQKYLSY